MDFVKMFAIIVMGFITFACSIGVYANGVHWESGKMAKTGTILYSAMFVACLYCFSCL